MNINFDSRFSVGDTAYMYWFGVYAPIKILTVQAEVSQNGSSINYGYRSMSDINKIDYITERELMSSDDVMELERKGA